MLASDNRWRGVWLSGAHSERQSLYSWGALPAAKPPVSEKARPYEYDVRLYLPELYRCSNFACSPSYCDRARVSYNSIVFHIGYGRSAGTLPSTPNGVWLAW